MSIPVLIPEADLDFVNTFPHIPNNEVFREHLLKVIEDSFSHLNKKIIIEGISSSGKTVLLSQFSRKHKSRSVSFFITEDHWGSSVKFFLIDTCKQMLRLSSDRTRESLVGIDIEDLSEDKLSLLFHKLYTDLGKQARIGKGPFYIVIDGLDKIKERSGEKSIISILPPGDPEGVYILGSSQKGVKYDFEYDSILLPFFSLLETEQCLSPFLTKSEINHIYTICNGMPGYITELLRQLNTSSDKQAILKQLPENYFSLLEKAWNTYRSEETDFFRILAVVVYANEKLSHETLSAMLEIELEVVSENIAKTGFMHIIENKIEIIEAYKHFLKRKLQDYKTEALQVLIKHYTTYQANETSMIFLPELYKEVKQYDALVDLIDVDNIYELILSTKNISIARRNLRILSSMASIEKDWEKLAWSSLTESIFTQISTASSTLEEQVKALLTLSSYKEAIKLAFSCVLPEDRLILLSYVCHYMQENHLDIGEDLLLNLEEAIDSIDNTVMLNEELIDKLLDISSNLFSIDTGLSLKLLKRIAEESGEFIQKDKLMDYLLLRLLTKVDNNNENIEHIKNQIVDEKLNDFLQASSQLVTEENAEKVIEKVNLINDASAKLFYLQNWCNINKKHKDIYKVIRHAIKVMTESEDYSPTQQHLRQFTQPLIDCEDIEVIQELLTNILNLKATVIKNPIEEYAFLELIISRIEKKWSYELAEERFFKVYFLLDEIYEIDSKCLVLVHLLEFIDTVLINEQNLQKELKNSLIKEFNKLVQSSAEHLKVTKKIIKKLSRIDKNLSLVFVSKLNMQVRRDIAYFEIAKLHSVGESIDVPFLESILDKISDPAFKEKVFVSVLGNFSKSKPLLEEEILGKYFGRLKLINSVIGKTIGFAYFIKIATANNSKKGESAYKELKVNLEMIDSVNKKVEIGHKLVQILAESNKEYANELYHLISNNYLQVNYKDSRLNNIFIKTCELLIKMIPDLLKSNEKNKIVKQIKKVIMSIPDPYSQCVLLSSLSLRCQTNGFNEVSSDIVETIIDIIETCNDPEIAGLIIIEVAPALYEYQEGVFIEKLGSLKSIMQKETAIENVIKFIITKRPPEDPIDIKSFHYKITYPDAMKVCRLMEMLERDAAIFGMLSFLVNSLLEPSNNNKIKSRLKEKQLLSIAVSLSDIIEAKLPDKTNIKHDGYKIACYGYLAKLGDTSSHRANKRWDEILKPREELRKAALRIANISDKVFVLTSLGEASHDGDSKTAIELLHETEKYLNDISNPYDRAERYELVAKAYLETSNNKAAESLLREALACATICTDEQSKDQLLGGIVELAHSIDPSLGNSYASNIDSKEGLSNFNDKVMALNLHSDPKQVENYNRQDTNRVLNDVFSKVLKTLCSGRGTIQHNEVIGKWLNLSVGHDFDTIILCISWYLENTISGNKKLSNISELEGFYYGILRLLELISKVQSSITEEPSYIIEKDKFYSIFSETDFHTFGLEEQEEAFSFIKNWVKASVSGYLTIYDPYFNEEMLELLKSTPTDARINILTSARIGELEELQDRYRKFWLKICDQVPPSTNFFVFATNSGETPIHDRFLATEGSALSLGTSLNGFGNKYSSIKIMDKTEKEKIEIEMITPLMYMAPTKYKNEKLVLKTFSLLH